MTEILDPKGWKFYTLIIVLLVAAIAIILVIVYPVFTSPPTVVPGESQGALYQAVTGSPTPVQSTPGAALPSQTPVRTKPGLNSTLPATSIPTPQGGIVNPVPFSLSVSPLSASARPGETLTYTLDIQGGEGITEPIHLSLTAKALFFSQTYDLGDLNPPFPQIITRDFQVPGNLPSGITVNGVITATEGAQTESQDISLKIV